MFPAILVALTLSVGACSGGSAPAGDVQTGLERADDHAIGSTDARLTITEYASVACHACADFHDAIWPMLSVEYIETGKVRFVLREMLNGSAQLAVVGFSLAHCVAPERYFDMVDLLFQQQNAIFQAAGQPGGARNQYLILARSMGMSEAAFDACLNNPDISAPIIASNDRAMSEGVNGTPRIFLNGEQLDARRASGAAGATYFLGDTQILLDGEPVPARVDADTYRRILDHLLAQLDTETGEGSDPADAED
ncbi:thioredoxin domain-containing protein [uncultured Maricaulis sp.]|uniref:thioredoxin domain-containing protein n=1 Tax=uncultured Maricaulis sp. TaxID=174710 RepID=UPI0030DCD31F|tara:strand:- start:55919 stop:56674 length:756 start_codon:yes stop_codon:yes gene_type:complete